MRVIAGSAKRISLKTIDGLETRPTTDRIKETLFNMLQYDLADSRFLDLFAGSGGIGIEALSRGASQCVFVEKNRGAVDCIRQNLAATRLEAQAVVMHCDVMTALKRLEGKYQFDFVFLDPPYGQLWERQVLEYLAASPLIGRHSTVVVEASLDTPFSYLGALGFAKEREKVYKTNKHLFVHRNAAVGV
ncbi:MAG: 16S rRNA (guanine(966)-N(2))-methyltransferase RsmD [Lachnospiraceae bacterium]|nr:16S rRNA (guanine(966)-N(2))-methyltransferase RsmD [Lachnospiraceae bacterium]